MKKTGMKPFTSNRWANKMQCKLFEGVKIERLEKEINEWLEAQEYVKILTSKVTNVSDVIVVAIFYTKITKLDEGYNAK